MVFVFIARTAIVGAALLALANANTPLIEVQMLDTQDCSSWPNYHVDQGSTDLFVVQITNTGIYIDNNTMEAYWTSANSSADYMIVHNVSGIATDPFRCLDNSGLQARVPIGAAGNYSWQNLKVRDSADGANRLLAYQTGPDALDIQPHVITIDRQRLPGIYLGSNFTISWALKQHDDGFGDYWLPRLLPENEWGLEDLPDGEVTGFLRVDA